ncbi:MULTISPECIES: Spx/MgsR family RNA polymerase-binding regulatory protein [unclassified Breznakia]|uniref:Spx/MgsR family RNA polymerase-binding regulatory protein n=1 Tax=unclassified Breznakia TaxID=2623764 RepID=UPI0024741663|nr:MULTISPECIES: Spx/MgsR family RNA polymerase-binding regulatory protein [unclassified Breznakia]MDH6367025.1 arsenate reductase [Breznakia sp. PH1-1]MDH6404203.1 arsenate reductase [Breznakia sp. PF1-11]MDH6411912.1 arsenate reductase [Breznakia sp. PFB1-11]MDH6414191.1 arsenate reductase [Breznakia sp. PFB1-14]MDH6415986.1 arsenate reductase [Breznakia sp. PFB1-4]
MILLMGYQRCSTCQKAKRFLEMNNVQFKTRDIVAEKLTEEELRKLYEMSNVSLQSFWNTSGGVYRQMRIKDTIHSMSEEDQIKLLASNGMLVKRPILMVNDQVTVGFKEATYLDMIRQA